MSSANTKTAKGKSGAGLEAGIAERQWLRHSMPDMSPGIESQTEPMQVP